MIGLICRDKMEWDIDLPFIKENITMESAGLIQNRKIIRYDKLPTTLILVSSSIISQWEQEFKNTNLKYKIISCRRDIDNIEIESCDVIIVTLSMYNNLIKTFSNYVWKRFIFDEPGHVRVSGMKEINAGFNWFVTATPDAIIYKHQNCRGSFMKKIIGDGWCKIDEQFEGMILRNDIEFVKASFKMPPIHKHYYKCYNPLLDAVSGIVNDNILNMIAANDIEGAIQALGGKKTNNIIDLVRIEKLEEQTKLKADIHIYRNIKKDKKKLEIVIEKEKYIEEQLEKLNKRVDAMLKNNCPICKENLNKPVLEPKCHNIICGKCFLTWISIKPNCPMCRADVKSSELIYLSKETTDNHNNNDNIEKILTPLENVNKILEKNRKGKFIIFSAYDASFKPICRFFKENNISFSMLKGNLNTRKKNIDDFKNGDTQIIFLNSEFNSAGINLQEATDIILYHEMPSSTQNQIIGRSYRIGRTKPLNIHYLQS